MEYEDPYAALREIETICNESNSEFRKRMGTRVGNCLVIARAALAAVPQPVAFLHTMHMELGAVRMTVTLDSTNPYGIRGEDFDPSFNVTTEPLYRGGQPI